MLQKNDISPLNSALAKTTDIRLDSAWYGKEVDDRATVRATPNSVA